MFYFLYHLLWPDLFILYKLYSLLNICVRHRERIDVLLRLWRQLVLKAHGLDIIIILILFDFSIELLNVVLIRLAVHNEFVFLDLLGLNVGGKYGSGLFSEAGNLVFVVDFHADLLWGLLVRGLLKSLH